jgi:DNA modification methylase
MCGDATKDVDALLDGAKIDMVYTDPPYGMDYQSNMRTKSDKFSKLEGDADISLDWIDPVWNKSKGFFFIWTTWKVIDQWFNAFPEKPSNVVVWDKGGGGIGDLKKTFSTDHEMCLIFHRGNELLGKRHGSVWSIGKDHAGDYKHPTQKPVGLAEFSFDSCCKSSGAVLDVFGGSGSTLIACEKTNRTCYMMELEPKYIDVIIKRWEDYTGKKAELING